MLLDQNQQQLKELKQSFPTSFVTFRGKMGKDKTWDKKERGQSEGRIGELASMTR